MSEPVFKLPDEDRPDIRPHLRALEGGGEESGPPQGQLRSVPNPDESEGIDEDDQDDSAQSQSGEEEGSSSERQSSKKSADEDEESDEAAGAEQFESKKQESAKQDKQSFLKRVATKQNAKRAGIGGLIGGTLFGGVFGLATIVSGPGRLIQWAEDLKSMHFGPSKMMQDKRSTQQFLYLVAGQSERGRLGKVGNYMADKWEKRLTDELGLKSVYSPLTRRLIGYEITDPYKAADFKKDMPTTKTVQGQMLDSSGYPIHEGGNEMIDLRKDPARTRRAITRLAAKSIGKNRVTTEIAQRLLITRGNVKFHPWKNIVRDKTESIADYDKKVADERAKAEADATTGGGDIAAKDDARSKFTEIKGKLQEFIKTAQGPLIALMAVCGLKEFSHAIDAQTLNNLQTAERMGMASVNGGSQVESMKDYNVEQIGVYANELYDPVTKTSVTDDPGVQQESGKKPTGFDYVSGIRPTAQNQKPWFFDAVDQIPTDPSKLLPGVSILGSIGGPQLPSADICSMISTVSQAVTSLPVISTVMNAISALLDNVILKPLTGKSAAQLVKAGIDYFATGAVDTLARGAKKGGTDNVGVRYAMNDQMLAMGGRALDPTEEKGVTTEAMIEQKQEFASASFYDRYLNMYEPGSAIGSLAMALPHSRSEFFASIQKLPTQMADMLSASFGLGKVFAADQGTYDYGFPLVGFSLAEQNDPKYDNPYDNEQYMLQGDRLQRMNDEYGTPCFYMTVDSDGNLHTTASGDILHRPAKCDDKTNEELTHYRFYLADLVTGFSNACYEGDEDSCNQVGMGNNPASTTNTAAAPDIGDPFAASDTMTCAAGTDGGVQDGYHNGTLVKIRICNVSTGVSGSTVQVNARIASYVDKLYKDAAAAGVSMGGSGYVTKAGQVLKRQNNHCPDIYTSPAASCHPPTAIPGYSNHQMGEAIDFTQNGSDISGSSTGFKWLQTNAATYGLKNLPTETWHWSVDGN